MALVQFTSSSIFLPNLLSAHKLNPRNRAVEVDSSAAHSVHLQISRRGLPKGASTDSFRFFLSSLCALALLCGLASISHAQTLTALPHVSSLSCGSASESGIVNDACRVFLNAAAPNGGLPISLSSSSTAVAVPSSVTVAGGSTSVEFTARTSAVGTAQKVTLKAASAGGSATFNLNLGAVVSTMSVSRTSIAFSNTALNTAAKQYVTINSVGSWPLDVWGASISGTGFTMSGATFPAKLFPGKSLTLAVQFAPTSTGAAMGQLKLSTNSSAGWNITIGLTGSSGSATALASLGCTTASVSGIVNDACAVKLNGAAPSGGLTVNLSSSNSVVAVPAAVTVPAGATSAAFTAKVSAVGTNQTVTLKATSAGVAQSYSLNLGGVVSTMRMSTNSIAFGSVPLNSQTTQTVTLSSVGTWPLDVWGVSISGTGFTLSGATFPAKVFPGQSLTLIVHFAAVASGPAMGQMTVSTNSSAGFTQNITLSGTGAGTTTEATPSSTGVTYFLAPRSAGGSDSNSGLSASEPWLSPNHELNCGDVIQAAASTAYDSAEFGSGKWGTVTCPNKNNVAWLQCATFDGCKIYSTNQGIYVDHSFWGVQGWEVTVSAPGNGFCFGAAPEWSNPVEVHHIIFANNVANGCQEGGFSVFNVNKTASVDYLTIVGNIAYNAAQSSVHCYSGIDIFQPIQSDSIAGTHIYIAGNFSYGNLDPYPCAGTLPTDGEGIILDTLDGSEGGIATPFAAQTVVENIFLVANGGRGFEVQNNLAGSQHSNIYSRHNTIVGNNTDPHEVDMFCGEVLLLDTSNTQIYSNIVVSNRTYGCGGYPVHAFAAYIANSTDQVYDNFAYGLSGEPEIASTSGAFTYSTTNTLGVSPSFVSEGSSMRVQACSGTASNVSACMSTMIANFTSTAGAAGGMGYQAPSSTPISDPLFPQWLCNVKLPQGLITMGCARLNRPKFQLASKVLDNQDSNGKTRASQNLGLSRCFRKCPNFPPQIELGYLSICFLSSLP